MQASNDNIPDGDLLLGVKPIAAFLGLKPRQTYRLIYEGILPVFKLGGSLSARRSTLHAWLVDQEQGRGKTA